MVKEDVIIIGAGLAGLTAARQIGSENVLLLEKNNYVGGRIKTIAISDAFVDVGSQFFCGTDENVWRLLRENNLEKAVLKLDFSNMAFFHNNRVEEINDDHLALIEDIVERFDHFDGDKKISFDEWFLSTYGERRKLYIPYSIIRAISFSKSKDVALSYAVYVIRSFFDECFTLGRGLGELVKPLHKNLKIITGKEVTSLLFKDGRIVGLRTKDGERIDVKDKFVVLTTPPGNIEVIHNLKLREILSKIKFTSCSLIAFEVRKIYEEKPYQIFVGDNKQRISVVEQIDLGDRYFIGCLVPHPRREKSEKNHLIELCKRFLRKIFDKDIDRFILRTIYEKWEDALPVVDRRHLDMVNSIKRIDVDNLLLAGDYTTPNPSMDSAIWSGLEVGKKVIEIG